MHLRDELFGREIVVHGGGREDGVGVEAEEGAAGVALRPYPPCARLLPVADEEDGVVLPTSDEPQAVRVPEGRLQFLRTSTSIETERQEKGYMY